MPAEAALAAAAPKARRLDDLRLRRILRFTIAVTLATAYACYVNWTFSFMLIALVIPLMALPTPAPSLRFAAWTVTKLVLLNGLGLLLMLPVFSFQLFGLALMALILFVYFLLQARGRVAALNATFVIAGVTLVPAFGASSMDVGVEWAKGLLQAALAMFPVIWIAFAVLPQGTFPGVPNATAVAGGPARQVVVALRPVAVLMPLMIYMLGSENNIRYLIGYYQAAVIAQHPDRSTSKALAIDLMLATVYGCTAGLLMWWLVKLWPSLLWTVLLMALVSFVFASRIFTAGPRPVSPHVVRWSYGLSTLVFIFFPDAMTQGFGGDDAGAKFVQRILDYLLITAYSAMAVLWYDSIVDRLSALRGRSARGAA